MSRHSGLSFGQSWTRLSAQPFRNQNSRKLRFTNATQLHARFFSGIVIHEHPGKGAEEC